MPHKMKVKICGLADTDNAAEIAALAPNYVGFIFYPPSPRAVTIETAKQIAARIPPNVTTVGVFVDENPRSIFTTAQSIGLSAVQLCGTTQITCARELKFLDFKETIFGSFAATPDNIVILSTARDLPFDFLLFDTPSAQHGGTGKTFDWAKLKNYHGIIPFFLSGGIGPDNLDEALAFTHPMLCGFDLNSRLEACPGVKDIDRTRACIEKIRTLSL